MNLQSKRSIKQSENTDESATLTSTEDDANEAKQSDKPFEKATSGTGKKMETIVENGEKRTQYQLTPDQSNCGYGTHPESTSITSSEDLSNHFHQKPQRFHVVKKPCKVLSPQELKDRRRKKLVKRSKSSL